MIRALPPWLKDVTVTVAVGLTAYPLIGDRLGPFGQKWKWNAFAHGVFVFELVGNWAAS